MFVGGIIFDNPDLAVLNKNNIVAVGQPGGILEILLGADEEVGIVFDIVDIVVAGFNCAGLRLSALGRGRSNNAVGDLAIGFGKIEDFVVGGIESQMGSRDGRYQALESFGEALKPGLHNLGELLAPFFLD